MLKLVEREERFALWRGPLRPNFMNYEVAIAYQAPLAVERANPFRQQPRVRVVSPILKQRPKDKEGALPHVYWDDDTSPALCLFAPATGEWTPMSRLSETTVPWTIDWLACYEGWRATGVWYGGGNHGTTQSQVNK
jgi:hypothetical protein